MVKLAGTPTARNLIRIFFLTERLKGLGGKDHGIRNVHVVGAGVMGGDIAAWSAYKGFEVTLQDREQRFIDGALGRAQELFGKRVKDAVRRPAVAARLKGDLDGTGVAEADLVIEAIIESPEAKRALYETVEPRLKANALLVTNTSSIPLDELREHIDRPAQFAGLHYFNPVAMMPLVEIVQHDRLDPAAVKRLTAFCKALDKFPVPVAGTPGFLVNRVLFPYMLEAATAYAEGIPGVVIDKAAVAFGMPMGPVELIDTVGMDVAWGVGAELSPFLGLQVPSTLATVEPGKRGKKDGKGIYKWEQTDKGSRPVKPEAPAGYQAPSDLEDRLGPAAAQRGGGLPARRGGRRCRPARCRGDLRHRFRPVPRRPDPAHPRHRRRRAGRTAEGPAGTPWRPFRAASGLGQPAAAAAAGVVRLSVERGLPRCSRRSGPERQRGKPRSTPCPPRPASARGTPAAHRDDPGRRTCAPPTTAARWSLRPAPASRTGCALPVRTGRCRPAPAASRGRARPTLVGMDPLQRFGLETDQERLAGPEPGDPAGARLDEYLAASPLQVPGRGQQFQREQPVGAAAD